MPHVEVNRAAAVTEAAEGVVKAPIEVVWDVLSDLQGWPRWNPGVSSMQLDGPVTVGTSFTWVAGGSRIVSKLEEVDGPARIAWSGRTLGIRAVHVWRLESSGEGTIVRTEESFDGLLARLLPGVMRRMLRKALRQGIESLRIEAETRSAV